MSQNQFQSSDPILRISVSEAARLFGVSTTTVRKAIKKQQIRYVVVRGRYKLNFQSVLEWSQKSTRRRNQRDQQGLGAYVDKWKIKNRLYSPNPRIVKKNRSE